MKCLSFLPSRAPGAMLALAAAATLSALPALAQGTDAQREACAPDAIKLCEDTIPDVPKTTACMKRHYAQLSPRCRTAFDEAVEPSTRPRSHSANREAPATAPPVDNGVETRAPERVLGLHAYQAHIREICRQGLVDAFTCRNTLDTLKQME